MLDKNNSLRRINKKGNKVRSHCPPMLDKKKKKKSLPVNPNKINAGQVMLVSIRFIDIFY